MASKISLSIPSKTVATGETLPVTIVNGQGKSIDFIVNVTVGGESYRLYRETVTTGYVEVPVSKNWFNAALGLAAVSSFTAEVFAFYQTNNTASGTFTVVAGDDMNPVIESVTVEPVNTGNAATYFPSAFIAGKSKIKAVAEVTQPTNATITGVTMNASGIGDVAMSYNNLTGKWEATTSTAPNGSFAYTVTAEDRRGLTDAYHVASVPVVPYTDPVVNIDAAGTYRCDPAGDEADDGSCYKAKANAVYTTGLTGNSLLQFDVRLQGESSGTALTSGVQSATISAGMNPGLAYTLVFTIQDKVIDTPATFTFELRAPNRDFVIHHSAGGTNVGVGTNPTVQSGHSTVELPVGGKFMIGGVSLVDIIYPVGSVYISAGSTSPQTLFGGTWTQIEDCFLLAAGQTYTAGDTGGEAEHTLTSQEMPSHRHAIAYYLSSASETGQAVTRNGSSVKRSNNANLSGYTGGQNSDFDTQGTTKAHNNMPPYLAVYVWQRTA